ncbi:MAG: hypothetical protein J5497_08760 [Selenomonadaceae bacterium]|nr:hypothetical protein [Selenomonadaceae bacterium]
MKNSKTKVDKLETRFATLEQQVSTVAAKVDMLVVESQQQREDIRRAQEKHDADMKEIRERQEAAQAKHDADMKEINKKIDDKFDKISSQLKMMAVTTILGVGAIVWAIVSAVK